MHRSLARRWPTRALIALALLLPAAPASARPPTCEEVQTTPSTICSTTVLVGSQTRSVQVRVPARASFEPGGFGQGTWSSTSVSIQGGGDFVGYALKGTPGTATEDVLLIGGRLPTDALHRDVFADWSEGGLCFDGCVLPGGDYTLALLADGPARVEIAFAGAPSGERTLTPSAPSPAGAARLPVRTSAIPGNLVYSAGDFFHLGEEGEAMVAFWFGSQTYRATVEGACILSGEQDLLPSEVYFGPGCPGEQTSAGPDYKWTGTTFNSQPWDPIPYRRQLLFSSEEGWVGGGGSGSDQHTDTYGLGTWVTSTDPLDATGAVGIWLAG
jgi:hypothetical protein